MKILLTGSEGFLGKILLKGFAGKNITTLGRSEKNDIVSDVTDKIPVLPKFDLVVHAIGLAHKFPKTKFDNQLFYDVNVQGTKNLLNALEGSSPNYFVFISSVSVYGKTEGALIDENTPLLAVDAYGRSKIEAEDLILEWCKKHNVKATILRLPLVAGPNPPGNLGNMINAIKKGFYFNIDHGRASKSVVLAEDIAPGILQVYELGGIYNLTDGVHPDFKSLSFLIASELGCSKIYNLPLWVAKILAYIGNVFGDLSPINIEKFKKITSNLTFDDTKARLSFGWDPTPVLKGFKLN